MTMIAVTVGNGCPADPAKVARWCAAADAQAQEFAEAWGVEYTPVVFFSADVLQALADDELAAFVADTRLLTIETDIGEPGALGFHDDVAGVIFARVEYQGDETSMTLSHEVLEEIGDPTCDAWRALGDGREQAFEACDRVEGDWYNVEVDGEHVKLSNYLLPAAFDPNGRRPFDRLGKLDVWDGMTPGGYTIIRDADGVTSDVFARGPAGEETAARRRNRAWSRTARRVTRKVSPPPKKRAGRK